MKTEDSGETGLPKIVSRDEWLKARQALLTKEKELTHALDALAAERRRSPMVPFSQDYRFEGPAGSAGLLDLFDGRRQLAVYHFMWLGAPAYCPGCSSFVDNIGNLAHLHAHDTSMVLVSDGPLAEILPFKERMGWTLPWYSVPSGDFQTASGVRDGGFGLSIFLRSGGSVFQTYFTTDRGVDRLRFDSNILDLTPFGRQEAWEDSPDGWPKILPHQGWHLHDEYERGPSENRS